MTFQEFLLRLAHDEDFRKRYVDDPDAVLEAEGLGGPKFAVLLEILRSGKIRQVRVSVEAEIDFDGEHVTISSDEYIKNVYSAPQADD